MMTARQMFLAALVVLAPHIPESEAFILWFLLTIIGFVFVAFEGKK